MHASHSILCLSRAFTCIIYGSKLCKLLYNGYWTSGEVGDLKPAHKPLLVEPFWGRGGGCKTTWKPNAPMTNRFSRRPDHRPDKHLSRYYLTHEHYVVDELVKQPTLGSGRGP